MDMFTAARRSEIMRGIQGTNTRAEVTVRRLLHSEGFRFRLHSEKLPGKPDIVLPKYHAVIFVHGCFWHGHTCKDGRRPKSNTDYWNRKLDRNLARDAMLARQYEELGWKRIIVWACELRDQARLLERLQSELHDAVLDTTEPTDDWQFSDESKPADER